MKANWRISSFMPLVPLITALSTTTTLAAEFPKSVTQWTCSEFLSVDDEFKSAVVSWATTFAKGHQPEAGAIEALERVTAQIIRECTMAPQASFWSSLNDGWKKIEAETEAE